MHIKKQTSFECYRKTMFDETLDVYPHEKTFKERQQSMLDQHLTSTEQSQKT